MYKVMIVDDELIIREGLSTFIDWNILGCEVVCLASDGLEAIDYLSDHEVDILITDIRMPGKNGLELASYVNRHLPNAKLIILSGYSDFKYAQEALRQGAFDFILKDNPLGKIENAVTRATEEIRKAAEKQVYLDDIQASITQKQQELQIKFYQDLIYDVPLSAKIIEEKSKMYCPETGEFCCILIKIRITDDTARIENDFLNAATKFLSSIFAHAAPIIFPLQSNVICMIVNDTTKLEACPLIPAFRQLFAFSGHYAHYQLKVSISNSHTNIRELNDAYLECCYCFKHNTKSSKQIFFYRDESLAAADTDSSNRPLIKKALQYIENNYSQQITLPDIASAVGLNASYLSRIFKKETGLSITEYLTKHRIEKAKELLKDDTLRLRDIAEAVGFNDVSYFSNTFKKVTEVTPTEYRTISGLI